jgi:hypothetical protein
MPDRAESIASAQSSEPTASAVQGAVDSVATTLPKSKPLPDGDPIEEWVATRRHAHNKAHPEESIDDDAARHGLAFSGGGIRSATICLGFARALAERGQWSRHDLLSTVSGGGYTGAMLGRLASRCRDGTEWRKVVEALGAATRERPSWLQWWLRANGRYLIPSGFKDSVFAATTYLRNVIAVHIELGLACMLLGCAMAFLLLASWRLRAAMPPGWQAVTGWLDDGLLGGFVPVPLLVLPLLMAWALALSLAYWAVSSSNGRVKPGRAVFAWFVAGVVLALVLPSLLDPATERWGTALRSGLFVIAQMVAPFWLLGWWIVVRAQRNEAPKGSDQRNLLTRRLSSVLALMLTFVAFAAVDRAAWALAFEVQTLGEAGIGLAFAIALLRALLPKADRLVAGRISTAALTTMASLLGWALAFGLVAWWVSVVYRTVLGAAFGGETSWLAAWLDAGTPFTPPLWRADLDSATAPPVSLGRAALVLVAMTVVPGVYSWASRHNVAFLNASSLHNFYCARLVRSYLGAVNPLRFGNPRGPLRAAEEMPAEPVDGYAVNAITDMQADDDLPMTDYAPHAVGAPVHLVNVCVNQTHDPRGGLYNCDRLGLPLTIGPGQRMRVGLRPWQNACAAGLTLGGWTAISGAAVSPGLGNRTRGGLSVLTMLAGIRLGYWWDGLPGADQRPARSFAKQAGLLDELTASFPGTGARQAFLTDGGHAENMGVFALLAARCELVIAVDCGADPDFRFSDLENLIRRARIDLDADIEVLRPKRSSDEQLPAWLGLFGTLDDLKSQHSEARLALALIRYADGAPGLLLLVKPTMWSSMPTDLANYHQRNPSFPQQTTADQFFDEEQWESYYKLGDELGQAVAEVLSDGLAADPAAWEANFSRTPRVTSAPTAATVAAASVPARLAARLVDSPLQTSVGVGVSLTAAIGLWQSVDGYFKRVEERQQVEAVALKELTELWGGLPAALGSSASTGASAPAGAARAGELGADVANNLAARLARMSDTLCASDGPNWFTRSPLANVVLSDARATCVNLGAGAGRGCEWLLRADQGPARSCLLGPEVPRDTCTPRYWAYDYRDVPGALHCQPPRPQPGQAVSPAPLAPPPDVLRQTEVEPEAAAVPPASPPLPPSPAASASASAPPQAASAPTPDDPKPCVGVTVYLQVFGGEWRESARELREPWRQLGASVEPIEDVLATSLANQRIAPLPVRQAELRLRMDDPSTLACARALAPELRARYGTAVEQDIPKRLSPKTNVIEIWLPSRPAASAPSAQASQAAASAPDAKSLATSRR